jgi:hypothetical protein
MSEPTVYMSPLHQEWREQFSDKHLQSSAVNFPCNWGWLRDHIIELYNLHKHQIIHIFLMLPVLFGPAPNSYADMCTQ